MSSQVQETLFVQWFTYFSRYTLELPGGSLKIPIPKPHLSPNKSECLGMGSDVFFLTLKRLQRAAKCIVSKNCWALESPEKLLKQTAHPSLEEVTHWTEVELQHLNF